MLDRVISAVVALNLAFLVWLYVRSRNQETLDNIPVPVQISLPPGLSEQYELEVHGPSQVPITFTGPPSRIRELRTQIQRGELRIDASLTVPEEQLAEDRYLDTVRVEASDVHPPAGVKPLVLEGRNRIPVTLHRLIERRLPVRFEPAAGERVSQVAMEPASVLVRGPKEVLDQVRTVPTQPRPLPPDADSGTGQQMVTETVPLAVELQGRRIRTTPSSVRVQLTLQPRQKVYELTDVPVQFLCPAGFPLRPLFNDERAGKITLRLQGPTGEEAPAVLAFIDLSGKKWEPGLYEEPLKLQLPSGFQLAQTPPRLLAFQLLPLESGGKSVGVIRGP